MKMCKRFTTKEVETIKKLYKDHLLSEIADILGRSPRVIQNKIRFLGLTDRPNEMIIIKSRMWKVYEDEYSMPMKDLLYSLYWNSNKSLLEIADVLNVCNRTVNNWMIELDIPRRSNSEGTKCRYSKMTLEEMNIHVSAAQAELKRCYSLVSTEDRGFIRDSDWLKISETVKKRDNFACKKCNITEDNCFKLYGRGLCIHHVIPYHICKKHNEENLISLCSGCHLRLHRSLWWDEIRKQKKLLESGDANLKQSTISQF